MTIKLAKESIDLAIVTTNLEAMTRFYRDVLGLQEGDEIATRSTPGGLVRQFHCGASTVKLVKYPTQPMARAPAARGLGVSGYRYWTITVANLQEIVDACEGAGHPIVVPIKEIGPGVKIAIAEDPDGNWVEFLSTA